MNHAEIQREDLIDRYLMGRLPTLTTIRFEEHFFGCPECVQELEASWSVINAIRSACEAESVATHRSRARSRTRLAWGTAAATVLVTACVSILLRPLPGNPPGARGQSAQAELPAPQHPPAIVLESYRSGTPSNPKHVAALAQWPFLLRLDLRGLAASASYTVEIVDQAGQQVWFRSRIRPTGQESLDVPIADVGSLGPGLFWVRLAALEPDGGARLLREYSLAVEP
mgnify:CR=1 FL=1